MTTTYSGYGGQTCATEDVANRSYLKGIGQITDSVTGITGSTAEDAYERYARTGATKEQLAAFARRVGH